MQPNHKNSTKVTFKGKESDLDFHNSPKITDMMVIVVIAETIEAEYLSS